MKILFSSLLGTGCISLFQMGQVDLNLMDKISCIYCQK